jgi:hypothetical protein
VNIFSENVKDIKGDRRDATAFQGYKENSTAGGLTLFSTRNIEKCPVTGEDFGVVNWITYYGEALSYLKDKESKEEVKKEEVATNYIQYLAVAFRGANNSVVYNDPNYFQLSEDFIKSYLEAIHIESIRIQNAI